MSGGGRVCVDWRATKRVAGKRAKSGDRSRTRTVMKCAQAPMQRRSSSQDLSARAADCLRPPHTLCRRRTQSRAQQCSFRAAHCPTSHKAPQNAHFLLSTFHFPALLLRVRLSPRLLAPPADCLSVRLAGPAHRRPLRADCVTCSAGRRAPTTNKLAAGSLEGAAGLLRGAMGAPLRVGREQRETSSGRRATRGARSRALHLLTTMSGWPEASLLAPKSPRVARGWLRLAGRGETIRRRRWSRGKWAGRQLAVTWPGSCGGAGGAVTRC